MFSLAEENIFFYFTLCLKINLPRKQNLTMAKLRHFCICVARMATQSPILINSTYHHCIVQLRIYLACLVHISERITV